MPFISSIVERLAASMPASLACRMKSAPIDVQSGSGKSEGSSASSDSWPVGQGRGGPETGPSGGMEVRHDGEK